MHHHAIKVGRAAERQECVTAFIAPSPSAWAHGPTSELLVCTHAGEDPRQHACAGTLVRGEHATASRKRGGIRCRGTRALPAASAWQGTAETSQEFFFFSFSFFSFSSFFTFLLFLFFLFEMCCFPSTVAKEIIFQVYTA